MKNGLPNFGQKLPEIRAVKNQLPTSLSPAFSLPPPLRVLLENAGIPDLVKTSGRDHKAAKQACAKEGEHLAEGARPMRASITAPSPSPLPSSSSFPSPSSSDWDSMKLSFFPLSTLTRWYPLSLQHVACLGLASHTRVRPHTSAIGPLCVRGGPAPSLAMRVASKLQNDLDKSQIPADRAGTPCELADTGKPRARNTGRAADLQIEAFRRES